MEKPKENIDEYIAGFPEDVQQKLQQVRETIKAAAPDAGETIKYAIPTFVLNGNLVTSAASKIISGFIPHRRVWKNLKKNYRAIKGPKARFSFRLMSLCPSI